MIAGDTVLRVDCDPTSSPDCDEVDGYPDLAVRCWAGADSVLEPTITSCASPPYSAAGSFGLEAISESLVSTLTTGHVLQQQDTKREPATVQSVDVRASLHLQPLNRGWENAAEEWPDQARRRLQHKPLAERSRFGLVTPVCTSHRFSTWPAATDKCHAPRTGPGFQTK